jgi:hypothetical protein
MRRNDDGVTNSLQETDNSNYLPHKTLSAFQYRVGQKKELLFRKDNNN